MRGERKVTNSPDEVEIWKNLEPNFRVGFDEPFKPFEVEDFNGLDISASDFYIGLSFTLEGFGVGLVHYMRDQISGFNRHWAEEHAATPVGPAQVSYQFELTPQMQGSFVAPLELICNVHGRPDYQPPDHLLSFPNYQKAIMCRWEATLDDTGLHPLPLVLCRKYLLPEWKEVKTIYLPENPKVLSDLTVTFLATDPRNFAQRQ